MKKLLLALAVSMLCVSSAWAAGFVNGGFEDGDFNGWTQGGGWWTGSASELQFPGSYSHTGFPANNVITSNSGDDTSYDPIAGSTNLKQVYDGDHSARVSDSVPTAYSDPTNNPNSYWNYSVSTLIQTVDNYTAPKLGLAWAAVLQYDMYTSYADKFILSVQDVTAGYEMFRREFNSHGADLYERAMFKSASTPNWLYTDWQVSEFDIVPGHKLRLELLAADGYGLNNGRLAGYVYLDLFTPAVVPPGLTDVVPEPATMLLLGLGLVGLAGVRRKLKG